VYIYEVIAKLKLGYHFFGPLCISVYCIDDWRLTVDMA